MFFGFFFYFKGVDFLGFFKSIVVICVGVVEGEAGMFGRWWGSVGLWVLGGL